MPRPRETTLRELRLRVQKLVRHSGRHPVNDADLREAERIARVLNLSAQVERDPPWRRIVFVAVPVAAVVLATCRQPSANVRVRVEATRAVVTLAEAEKVALEITGSTTILGGVTAQHVPPELQPLLSPSASGDIVFRATPQGIARLESWKLQPATELTLSSGPGYVDIRSDCHASCRDSHLRMAFYGELPSREGTTTVTAPTPLTFAPESRGAVVRVENADSIIPVLSGPVSVSEVVFDGPGFRNVGSVTALGSVSTIRSGVVTLRDYPSRTWTLVEGDELHLSGEPLKLTGVRHRAGVLSLELSGRATAVRLGHEDLRPTLWDWIYTNRYWPVIAAACAALTGLVASAAAVRGRQP